ncbi:MAG: shikimate kinase [bacterium]
MNNNNKYLNLQNKNLIIMGFSGSGKTIIGKTLSELYNLPFVDTDINIQISQNLSIQNIFRMFGEDYFRVLETEMCKKISELKNTVISVGGGTVLDPKNVKYLKQNGILVYLKSSPEQIYKNIQYDDSRPLLNTSNKFETICNLLDERSHTYENISDISISAINKSPILIAVQIQKKLQDYI